MLFHTFVRLHAFVWTINTLNGKQEIRKFDDYYLNIVANSEGTFSKCSTNRPTFENPAEITKNVYNKNKTKKIPNDILFRTICTLQTKSSFNDWNVEFRMKWLEIFGRFRPFIMNLLDRHSIARFILFFFMVFFLLLLLLHFLATIISLQ